MNKNNLNFDEMKIMFGKALSVNKDKYKGDIISIEDLESKKPGNAGVPAKDFELILGKKIKRKLSKGDFITQRDIENDK